MCVWSFKQSSSLRLEFALSVLCPGRGGIGLARFGVGAVNLQRGFLSRIAAARPPVAHSLAVLVSVWASSPQQEMASPPIYYWQQCWADLPGVGVASLLPSLFASLACPSAFRFSIGRVLGKMTTFYRWLDRGDWLRKPVFLYKDYSARRTCAYLRFRLGTHDLGIELGRWSDKKPRHMRLCNRCDQQQLDDERHLEFECTAFEHLRAARRHLFAAAIGEDMRAFLGRGMRVGSWDLCLIALIYVSSFECLYGHVIHLFHNLQYR